jgi:hypothetical protein
MLAGQLLASGRGPLANSGKTRPLKPNVIFIGASRILHKVFKISLVYFTRRPVSLCSTSNNRATLETSQGQLCGEKHFRVDAIYRRTKISESAR